MDHAPYGSESSQPNRWMDLHLDTSSTGSSETPEANDPSPSIPDSVASHEDSEKDSRPKRRGPKPITDMQTLRFEGKAYPYQIVQLRELETHLKLESKNVPAAERRRVTLNTFVRLGLDVVLAHADNLAGANEDDLLDSLYRSIAQNPTARSSRK